MHITAFNNWQARRSSTYKGNFLGWNFLEGYVKILNSGDSNLHFFFFFFANPSYQIFLIFYKPQFIGCWNHSLSHEVSFTSKIHLWDMFGFRHTILWYEVSFTSKIQLWDMFGFRHTILWYIHNYHMVHIISLYTDYWPFLTYYPI